MYCRRCGNKMGDMDRFCHACGAPAAYRETPSEPAGSAETHEEIIFNPPYANPSNYSKSELQFAVERSSDPDSAEGNLKDVIDRGVKEEAEKSERKEEDAAGTKETGKKGHLKESEFVWNIYEFPKGPKKTEDIDFNWNLDEYSSQEEKKKEAKSLEEALFKEMEEDSRRLREKNIDRFFTFSRKNEEFQELLDREYERLRSRNSLMKGGAFGVTAPETKKEPAETEREKAAATEDITSGQQDGKTGTETAEVTASIEGEAAFQAAEPETQAAAPETVPETQAAEPETQTIEPEKRKAEPEISEERTEQAPLWQEEQEPEGLSKLLAFSRDKHEAVDDLEARIQEAFAMSEQEREGEQTRKWNVWTVLFAVIAVILAIEIAILGIRYFAPDSAAADAINKAQTNVVRTISGWVDGIKELFSGQDSDEGTKTQDGNVENGEDQTGDAGEKEPGEGDDGSVTEKDLPDPNPAADKNELISSQLGNNVNIGQVKANDALAWLQGKDYGVADINNSKPIENNIWQLPDNGKPVYYDQSIVGTIIAFDSQWIDYVNNGNKSVLDLLKKGSEAYRKVASFSGIGKIKETFKLLEIGEIRKGAAGFYVWTHEEIQVTEGGKTKDKKYNWIYYLEPIDGKMKIVNYYRY